MPKMRGYWTQYGYCGQMPDCKWRYFATDGEYREAYEYELKKMGH